jgi:hypothetical protein
MYLSSLLAVGWCVLLLARWSHSILCSRHFCGFFEGRIKIKRPLHKPSSPPKPHVQWVPGANWLGHEADHSPPYSAEVKNAWSYTSIRLHGVVHRHRDNFFLHFLRGDSVLENPAEAHMPSATTADKENDSLFEVGIRRKLLIESTHAGWHCDLYVLHNFNTKMVHSR